jgi:WD40 repeat protein
MIGHSGPISGIATFRDDYIATAGYDSLLLLWTARQRRAVSRGCHDHLVNSCSFSNGGNLIASASSDYSARIWSVPELRLNTVLRGHEDDVEMAVFSPDDKFVATASRDCSVRIFDLEGRQIRSLIGHERDVLSVAWSRSGDRIVTSGDDGTVREWEAATGAPVRVHDLSGAETDTITLTKAGLLLAGDDTGSIWIVREGDRVAVPAHEAGVKRLILNESSSRLLSISYDRSVCLWSFDNAGLNKVTETKIPDIVWPRSAAFLGSDEIVFGTFGSCFATWRPATGEWESDHIVPDKSLNAVCLWNGNVFSIGDAGVLFMNGERITDLGTLCNFVIPFENCLITGGQNGCVFDGLSGEKIYQHYSPLNCAAVARRNGRAVCLIGTYTGEALMLQEEGGALQAIGAIRLHENAIKGLASDSGTLFSVCATGAVAFHDLANFERRRLVEPGHEKIANGGSVIRGGFASVGRDRRLCLWRGDAAEIIESPHRNSIKCICSDSSGGFVMTGTYTGWVAGYDLDRKQWSNYERLSTSGVSCLCYDEAGRTFIAVSYDGQMHRIGQLTACH